MERKIDLGFGALAAERGLAITSDQMFRDIYIALDEESSERASTLGSLLLCQEVGISQGELDKYLEGEGVDLPPAKLAVAFLGL